MVICMFQWTSMNLLFGEDRFADIDFSSEVQWNNYCYNAVIACTKENLGNEELPFCHENWFECIWMWQWELYINVFVHHCFITVLPDAWEAVLGTQVDIALHFVDSWEYTCATYSRALLDSLQFVVAINKPCGWTTQLPKLTNHFFRQCFQRVLVVAHVLSVFLISFHTHAIWAYEVSQYTYIKYWYKIFPTIYIFSRSWYSRFALKTNLLSWWFVVSIPETRVLKTPVLRWNFVLVLLHQMLCAGVIPEPWKTRSEVVGGNGNEKDDTYGMYIYI